MLTQDKIVIIAASAAGVLVVVVVVVVVLMVNYRKRNSVTLSNEVRFQSQPTVATRPLQFTTGQGHISDQDQEGFCYQILPDRSARRVVVLRNVQDFGKIVYDDVQPEQDVLPHLPVYKNVPPPIGGTSPNGHLEGPGVRGSHLYATVP
ncbi:hypothetical protein O3P69_009166 [Scylla paramamosain]|uniref:Uncharacterized protein n=1 Tax=Scylla paramamosain TaxID=85552 RepID=A0AAW0TAK9_SCYPA